MKRCMAMVFCLSVVGLIAFGADLAQAQGSREQSDKRDVLRQDFLKRLPLESNCKAELAGGVLIPPGETVWRSGSFELEAEDDFRVRISLIAQLHPEHQATCEAQARALEYDDAKRALEMEQGHLLCMQRTFRDPNRLPQMLACRLSTLLTQPLHLRCKNLDPILDPDGVFISPNLLTVVSLPQAVMVKGSCQAADRY